MPTMVKVPESRSGLRQNLRVSSVAGVRPFSRILCKSVEQFLRNPDDEQTN